MAHKTLEHLESENRLESLDSDVGNLNWNIIRSYLRSCGIIKNLIAGLALKTITNQICCVVLWHGLYVRADFKSKCMIPSG